MSTRGTVGFVINGEEKLTYNHSDSYPDGLGVEVLKFLRKNPPVKIKDKVAALQVIDPDVPATRDQILALRPTTNWYVNQYSMAGPQPEDVSPTSPDGLPDTNVSWYNLLRGTQGELGAILDCGYMEDGSDFPLDSLFCEWAYVVDFDKGALEVYKGFQKERPTSGRWAGRPTDEENAKNYEAHLALAKERGRDPWKTETPPFQAIALAGTFPLDDLPTDKKFCKAVWPPGEEDD